MGTIECNQHINVLDKGYIKLVDMMPRNYQDANIKCDESIVRAARVSYNKGSKGTERDTKLIRYLVEHKHMVPLESVVFQFQIKCPIFVQRHIVKHRMSSMNEVSARYTEVKDEWYIPQKFRAPSSTNKQSSEEIKKNYQKEINEYSDACENSYQCYKNLLSSGVAREMARVVLPQSMYTIFYLKMDLRNALHFCNLRNSSDSQWETQQYAKAMEDIISITNPISWSAFRK